MEVAGASLLAKVLPTSPSALVWCGLALAMGGGQIFTVILDYDRLETRVAQVEKKVDDLQPSLASMATDINWIKKEMERKRGQQDAPR